MAKIRMIVAVGATIILIFAMSKTKNPKAASLMLAAVAVGAFASVFIHLPAHSFGTFSRLADNLSQDTINAMSSGRIALWQLTWSYIQEQPIIGYGILPHKDLPGFTHGSAHNFILDAWLWFGVIIGTLVLAIGLALWFQLFGFFRRANDQYLTALFSVVTTLAAYSVYSGPYARTFPLLIFAMCVGTLLGRRAASNKAATETENQVMRATT